MNRTSLRPIRTRRVVPGAATSKQGSAPAKSSGLSLNTRRTLGAIGTLWIAFAASAHAVPPAEAAPTVTTAQKNDGPVSRGRYLVEQVGLCADCHSPRNEKGEFLRDLWLKGAPLAFQPAVPMPWSPVAPPIAGLPSMTEAQGVAYLQNGTRPDGSVSRPPMPEFRFSAEDATAVVAYLKSLAK